jgi:uncharacterized protein (DUF433 family)
MPDLIAVRGTEPWRRRLYLPAYRIADAAKYVQESPQAIANWHFRETLSGVTLPGKERRKPLSYLQLIEIAVVSRMRKLGLSLPSIRKARQYLAQNFHSEYPLAEYRFKTEGFHVLLDLEQFDHDEELRLIVADKGGQLAWEQLMEDRLMEFDYEHDLAIKWHLAGRKSLVVIDPRVAFGAPTVSGIPTWILKGRYNAGETIDDIEDDFRVPRTAIKDGLTFEGIKTDDSVFR